MVPTSQSGNVFLDILNNHGDTLQQLALLAYLSKGEEAKPFLQATTAAKVNTNDDKKFIFSRIYSTPGPITKHLCMILKNCRFLGMSNGIQTFFKNRCN